VNVISETIVDTICLKGSKAELKLMKPFVQTEFFKEKILDYAGYRGEISGVGSYFYLPYVTSEIRIPVTIEQQQIPLGELVVRRGTRADATDGYVGKVDEFIVNPHNGHITYLVMREGHLWGQKDVIIPISAMEDTGDDT
jgi:hypothetical protein